MRFYRFVIPMLLVIGLLGGCGDTVPTGTDSETLIPDSDPPASQTTAEPDPPPVPQEKRRELHIEAPENLAKQYADGTVTVIEEEKSFTAPIQIELRGNSTSEAPKKPWNIKFEESVSLFGMEEGRKWSLLANAFDKTMLRNKLALDFGLDIGLAYTSQSEFAEVWYNGRYVGCYQVCEARSDGKNRIQVDTSANEFILEVTPFGGKSFTSNYGVPIYYDSPKEPTSEQKEYLKRLLDLAEEAMLSRKASEYTKYIDAQSFVDLYVLMELFKDVDGYHKSLYFYVKDDKLWAGPPWDFDLSCGNVSRTVKETNYYNYHNINGRGDGSGDSTHGLRMVHGWFEFLLLDPAFAEAVRERYLELQPLIVNLYADNELGMNRIDWLLGESSSSFEREYRPSDGDDYGADWDINRAYSMWEGEPRGSYEDNLAFLRTWLEQRNLWLLENIGR